jgi:transcriptional regulator with XRE-family HTH domain
MTNTSRSARTPRLSSHIGVRLRNRRVELGLGKGGVAAHLGIALSRYEEFETGEVEIPALSLGDLADLFNVPMFYFFQDMAFGDDADQPSLDEPATILAVATEEDRIATLVSDFLNASWEGQQYLLMLARTLARDGKRD